MNCFPSVPDCREARAMALVVVLGALVLISVLVVGFLASVRTELSTVRNAAVSEDARQLADSALNIVMAQIRDATSSPDLAWASQPGMIRTFDDQGSPKECVRLYSWEKMRTKSVDFDPAAERAQLTAWSASPSLFTDLNEPALIAGKIVFPIIDGNNLKTSGARLIYDQNTDGVADVEGFYVKGAPAGDAVQPIPMPAKWLYVLRDGSLITPGSSSGKTVSFDGAAEVPSSDNPIVGRIAFWTDDETNKININTASEGTFWDMPRAEGTTERNLGKYQPAFREFQRYPGHPGMVSLSTVFPNLTTTQLYAMAPRISDAGASNPGTSTVASSGGVINDNDRLYGSMDELLFKPALASGERQTNPITKSDLERAKFFITASSRAPEVNLFNRPRISIWPTDSDFATSPNTARATATDRVIAFCSTMRNDLPADKKYRYYFQRHDPDSPTADINIARNLELYKFLQFLTGTNIPGFGGNFLTKYQTDRDQLLTQIFDYIRTVNLVDPLLGGGLPTSLTNVSRPSFAPARTIKVTNPVPQLPQFSSTYPWGFGMVTPSAAEVTPGVPTRGFGRFNTVSGAFLWFIGTANSIGDPAPSLRVINNNQDGSTTIYPGGTETPATATTTALQGSTASRAVSIPVASSPPIPVDRSTPASPKGYVRVQACLGLDFFCPGYNWPYLMSGFEYTIEGLQNFQWRRSGEPAYVTMGFPSATGQRASYWKGNQMPGGRQGFNVALSQKTSPVDIQTIPPAAPASANDRNRYPYVSGAKNVTATINGIPTVISSADFPSGSQIDFKGGTIVIKLYYNSSSPSDAPIQTITMNVPDGMFPLPSLAPNAFDAADPKRNFRRFFGPLASNTPGPSSTPKEKDGYYYGVAGRFSLDSSPFFIDSSDVIQQVVLASGDYRMIAGQSDVPASLFKAHADYGDGVTAFAHCLWGEGRSPNRGATYGCLVNGVTYGSSANFPGGHASNNATAWYSNIESKTGVAAGKTAAFAAGDVPGDWDNGMADEQDGPYINKVDEGNLYGLAPAVAGRIPYYTTNYQWAEDPTGTYFSPNRQLSSPGMFGSLPTGLKNNRPWQTLQLRPEPTNHPGLAAPRDHLMLDLFWMPVAEPYAISEPFSTAGKVNMNYRVMPYSYITRETAVRAVLKSEKLMVIPNTDGLKYKNISASPAAPNYRFDINQDETLKGFAERFDGNDLFRSASEICDVHLVPKNGGSSSATIGNPTYSDMSTFWDSYRLTGDNTRERPYANLYSRLTTKSNTFVVYYRAQALKKVPGTKPTEWVENRDVVTSEFRGSSGLERYIDPNDKNLPDFATDYTKTVEPYYRIRVINSKQFGQ